MEELLLNQYELRIKDQSKRSMIAKIYHCVINKSGGRKYTPIGYLVIAFEEADGTFVHHYSVQMFARNDVRYDINSKDTLVVSNPKGQAGPNKSLFERLIKLKNSDMPYYHPRLPDEIISYLIKSNICKEPIGMNICHYSNAGFRERGQLWEED